MPPRKSVRPNNSKSVQYADINNELNMGFIAGFELPENAKIRKNARRLSGRFLPPLNTAFTENNNEEEKNIAMGDRAKEDREHTSNYSGNITEENKYRTLRTRGGSLKQLAFADIVAYYTDKTMPKKMPLETIYEEPKQIRIMGRRKLNRYFNFGMQAKTLKRKKRKANISKYNLQEIPNVIGIDKFLKKFELVYNDL